MQQTSPYDRERLLEVRSGNQKFADMHVNCPVITRPVRLQRCAFCQHGYGLLLDSSEHTIALRCGAPDDAALIRQ